MESKQGVTGPPAPRLVPGSLLAACYEIEALLFSDQIKNIYLARDDNDDIIHIVEFHGNLPEPVTVPESCVNFLLEATNILRINDRTYMVFPRWGGNRFVEVEFPCSDEILGAWIGRFIQALLALDAEGIALDHLFLTDIYLENNDLILLIYPIATGEKCPITHLVYDFVKELLFRRVRPKLTRNLARPIHCLGLSAQLEDRLVMFLEKEIDFVPLGTYLQKRDIELPPYWDISAMTHEGRVRDHNEDAFAWLSLERETYRIEQTSHVLLVSDGMGGHQHGEVASHHVVSACLGRMVQSLFAKSSDENPDMLSLVGQALEFTQKVVLEEPELAGPSGFALSDKPGATLVAGLMHKRMLYVGHCGDSRAYLLDEVGLQRLTRDHSLVQLYVDQGQLSEEETFGHSHSNVITSFMGIDRKSFKSDVGAFYIDEGARLLLCSDGLTDMIRENEIEQILAESANAREACERLTEASNKAGGSDNITVLVVFDRQTDRAVGNEATPLHAATDQALNKRPEENNL